MSVKINKKIIIGLSLFVILIVNIIFMFYNIRTNSDIQKLKKKYIAKSALENNTKTKKENSYKDSKYKDREYKLFFGEWEVTKVIGKHATLPVDMEEAKSYIGKKVKYSNDEISYEGQKVIKNPQYCIAIVPIIDPERSYIEKMPSLGDIGISGEYFAYVNVGIYDSKIEEFLGDEFYIKDDTTLVACYRCVYYELKRISYIDDAKVEETHV